MKKILGVATAVLLALCAVSTAEAQYSRRDVRPPVPETGAPTDPSTPLGKVQEIADRIEKIERATEEIKKGLDASTIPEDYRRQVNEILEAASTTRAEVAQLGEIAVGVQHIVSAVDAVAANASAAAGVAESVGVMVDYLQYFPTSDVVSKQLNEMETRLSAQAETRAAAMETAIATTNEAFRAELVESIKEQRVAANEDAEALKNKLETASNIIIFLGFVVGALFIVNVGKFVYDKIERTKEESRRREADFQALQAAVSAASKKTTSGAK